MNIFMTFKNNKTNLIFSPTESKCHSFLHCLDPKTFCLCAPLAQWNTNCPDFFSSPFPLFHLSLFLSLHHYINPPWYHLSYIHSILSSLKPLVLSLSLSLPRQLTPAFIYTFPSHLSNGEKPNAQTTCQHEEGSF